MVEPVNAGIVSLLGVLALALLEGLRRRDVAATTNALVVLAAALVPVIVETTIRSGGEGSVSFGPVLTLWIATAGVLHVLGMLGPYDSIRWWDSLTHAVSAALVAALCYAALVVAVGNAVIGPPPGGIGVVTVLVTFAAGVFWELIELLARDVGERFDVEPVLVHYGRRDTALDLVFDFVGALAVVLFDLRVFVPVAEQSPRWAATLLLWAGEIVVIGSVALAIVVVLVGRGQQRRE